MTQTARLHFCGLPQSVRILYTLTLLVLGVGYLFAMIHLVLTYANEDDRPMLTAHDLALSYHGGSRASRLETALQGPMSRMAHTEDIAMILAWIGGGAKKNVYETKIAPVVEEHCLACHDGSNPYIPNLDGYDNIKKTMQRDTGARISTLVRVSHIHLFGLTFIFFITSTIFSHAYVKSTWLKSAIIVVPFVAILADVASWYLTKISPPFAWLVMTSGFVIALFFSIQLITSLYQIWIYKAPSSIVERGGELPESILGSLTRT